MSMKKYYLILIGLFIGLSQQVYADEKREIPKEHKWENTDDRKNNFPLLFQDDSCVYVYSEKEVDNLTIGITDMQGNTYHYEVTTLPAGTYYAISIESLPVSQYYLCIYQGSNYVIGIFQKH